MGRKILALSVFIAIIFGKSTIYAQNISVSASVDTNKVLIGDQINLKLKLKSDSKIKVFWPQFTEKADKYEYIKLPQFDTTKEAKPSLEIISKTGIDTVVKKNEYILTQDYIITCFDTGSFTIPPLTFMCEKKGLSDFYPYGTEPVELTFHTIAVDTTLAIKDIKPPLEEPHTIWEYLRYFAIVLGAIGLGFLGYFLWKRRKLKPKESLSYDPKIPPHVFALEALKKLDAEKLWQNGHVKLYYIRLTEIIRIYLERRFGILAMEMTSSEIVINMEYVEIESLFIRNMKRVFEQADLAKFAKFQPLPNENAQVMTYSIDFVNATKKADTDLNGNHKEKES